MPCHKHNKRTPKQRARPLDQANSDTCTLHAVANATVEKLMDINIDVNLDELVGGLKQLSFVNMVEGNHVEDFDRAVVKGMTDLNTKNLYDVELRILQCRMIHNSFLKRIQNQEAKCVFVYSQGCPEDPDPDYHCVFIRDLTKILGKLNFVCINSWGNENAIFCREVDRPCNIVFEVCVARRAPTYLGTLTRIQRTSRRIFDSFNVDSFLNPRSASTNTDQPLPLDQAQFHHMGVSEPNLELILGHADLRACRCTYTSDVLRLYSALICACIDCSVWSEIMFSGLCI